MLTVVDTYGVWSLDGLLKTQPGSGVDDALKNSMYVSITERSLQVHLRTPEGRLAWWHVQVEE